jgi:transposase
MNKPEFFVGIDIASATFTAAVGRMSEKWQMVVRPNEFTNAYDSFAKFLQWLQQHAVTSENAVVVMESTGVYGETLAHFLAAKGYSLAVESPLKVKRAFIPEGHKSDPVDSSQISEYAYRFFDELKLWEPRNDILEQIQTLLTTREQFVVDKIGHENALGALKRKVVRTDLAETAHQISIDQIKAHIKTLEEEIRRLIEQDPTFRNWLVLLLSIPGVGLLLAAHLIVMFQTFTHPLSPKALAAFIGICPYEHRSGTSVYRRPASRHYGPPQIRKLLYLAALSVRTNNKAFKQYFLRKTQEGKSGKLVINNIENKLLKIICAVVRSNTVFIPDYRSVNPIHLN